MYCFHIEWQPKHQMQFKRNIIISIKKKEKKKQYNNKNKSRIYQIGYGSKYASAPKSVVTYKKHVMTMVDIIVIGIDILIVKNSIKAHNFSTFSLTLT